MIRVQVAEFVQLANTGTMSSPPAPPLNGASVNLGKFNVAGFNRLRGQIICDQTGTCVINFRATTGGAVVYTRTVPLDGSQAANTYSWNDEPIRGQYVEIVFTNTSGVNAASFSAFSEALPN